MKKKVINGFGTKKKVVNGSGKVIVYEWEDAEIKKIKKFLTRRSKNYQSPEFTVSTFFKTTKNAILVPRFFPVEQYLTNYEEEDNIPNGIPIQIRHRITPRNKLQERAIHHMLTHDRAVMQLQPGTGKTVMMINVIRKLLLQAGF